MKAMEHKGNIHQAVAGEKGSVMMEYVIMAAFGASLMLFLNGSFFGFGEGFGNMGLEIVAFFERTSAGLSLPVP